MLVNLLSALSISLLIIAAVNLAQHIQQGKIIRRNLKKPLYIVLLNTYGPIYKESICKLSEKYNVKISVMEGPIKPTDYEEKHREFSGLLKSNGQKVEYVKLTKFIENNAEMFPDIIILCSNTTVFKISSPHFLYSAEMLHYRKEFSESIFKKVLMHYNTCEIRNGK